MSNTLKDFTAKELVSRFDAAALNEALKRAAYKGQFETVRYFLDRGAHPDGVAGMEDRSLKSDEHETPLAFAANGGHTEVMKLLLDRGAIRGLGAALCRAAGGQHADAILLLLESRQGALSDDDILTAQSWLNLKPTGNADCARLLELEQNLRRPSHTARPVTGHPLNP